MARRNFTIVDDFPDFAEKVERAVKLYYSSKQIYNYDTKTFFSDNHFEEASQYIQKYYKNIDIIFSDQNLRGGKGTDLFKIASKTIEKTEYTSIIKSAHIYKVMHSNIDGRFKENQQEYSVTYNYFVNSENENDILSFLNYYEEKILILKENGNKNYIDYLYSNPKMKKIFETSEGLIIDNQRLNLRDILFVVMDKRKNNSDYYYFFYIKNEEIIQSSHSIKPPSSFKYPSDSFNSIIESLSFIEGTLLDGQKEKFKINPLWISSINVSESTIKLFSPNSLRYQIRFDKLEDNFNEFIDQDSIDKFFL